MSQLAGVPMASRVSMAPLAMPAGRYPRHPRSAGSEDAAGQRRAHHDHRRHRQHEQPGVQRGVTAHILQVQGVREQEAAQRGERAHRDHRRPGKRRAAEEPQIDERLVAAWLPVDQAGECRSSSAKKPRVLAEVQPAPGASMIA